MKTLEELRAEAAAIKARADAKLAELKDDTPADVAKRIEDEHKAILRELADVNDQIKRKQEDEAASQRSAVTERDDRPAQTEQRGVSDADVEARAGQAAERAVRVERERVAEIANIGRRTNADASEIAEAVSNGTTVEAFRNQRFEAMTEQIDRNPTGGARAQFSGLDETQTRRDALESALLHRSAPGQFELSEPGRDFRGMTLLEMARDSLTAAGERVRGMSRHEIAERAFHTTSDFPYVLANVANKSLRRGYDVYPRTFTEWASRINLSDFKEIYRTQLGEAPQLELVNEHGEFKRGSIKESRESIRLYTYGKIIGITRQVIINDDLGAFTRIPQMFGTSVATLESDIVYALLNTNVVMGDGYALFSSEHNNLIGSGTILGVEGLSETRQKLRLQKGLDGKTTLNLRAKYLLLPSALETEAEKLLSTTTYPATVANGVPESMKQLMPIVEPRLDDGSETAYYLAADPATVDTIEYAYLEGQDGAYTENRQGFDVDGMEVKCRLDFGAAAVDFRGLAKNPGAAPAE